MAPSRKPLHLGSGAKGCLPVMGKVLQLCAHLSIARIAVASLAIWNPFCLVKAVWSSVTCLLIKESTMHRQIRCIIPKVGHGLFSLPLISNRTYTNLNFNPLKNKSSAPDGCKYYLTFRNFATLHRAPQIQTFGWTNTRKTAVLQDSKHRRTSCKTAGCLFRQHLFFISRVHDAHPLNLNKRNTGLEALFSMFSFNFSAGLGWILVSIANRR